MKPDAYKTNTDLPTHHLTLSKDFFTVLFVLAFTYLSVKSHCDSVVVLAYTYFSLTVTRWLCWPCAYFSLTVTQWLCWPILTLVSL